MSCEIQSQSILTLTDLSFFASIAEETSEQNEAQSSSLLNSRGELKSASKHYSLAFKQTASCAKESRAYEKAFPSKGEYQRSEGGKPSVMSAASAAASRSPMLPQKREAERQESTPQPRTSSQEAKSSERKVGSENVELKHFTHTSAQPPTAQPLKGHLVEKGQVQGKATTQQEKSEQRQKSGTPLASRQWAKEETKEWWETRYHQKERQGQEKGQDQEQQQQRQKEKQLRISKGANASAHNPSSTQGHLEGSEGGKVKKPELVAPRPGIFALYYLLTKIGLLSDGASTFANKKEIEFVDVETTETHKKRLEEIKMAIKKEKETARWGIAAKVFSWIAALIGIITGIALIATGVGAVAGAMLIAGGTIQIASQVMELSGGWQKVAEILPGDDTEKKRAVISWMQIGIAVLCLILSGVGVIWGGIAQFGETMQTAMSMLGGIASMGHGVTTIGEGIANFLYKDKLGDIKQFDRRLAQLKHMRQDLMEKMEWGIDHLEKLFEDLARALEFEEELFMADQMVNRR